MAYDYYCMGCGKKLQQDTVLFDMQYLLTKDQKKSFQILKFRMTQEELWALLVNAEPRENGYRGTHLTLPEVMTIISNSNNLNDPTIAALTMGDIVAYIENGNTEAKNAAAKQASDFDLFGSIDDEDKESEEGQEQTPEKEYVAPGCILAIEAKDTTNKDRAFTQAVLRGDLEILRAAFYHDNTIDLQLRARTENDNEEQKVLVGYDAHFPVGNFYLSADARVCCGCGTPVFKHAGTATHQAIAFIGYQSSGKTSTILALTHYAQNHLMVDLTDFGDASASVWKNSPTIPEVASIELLDRNHRLLEDIKGYSHGLAPAKTSATMRTDAYSATFRIKNRVEKKYYLLTLTDLPGELCDENGTLDSSTIQSVFPVALSCDAYVACFDTASIDPIDTGIQSWISNVCNWTDEFQRMRASKNQVEAYVPTMLLFTKCRDLEDPAELSAAKHTQPKKQPNKQEKNDAQRRFIQEQTYMLKNEQKCIANNGLYASVQDRFKEFGQLGNAYYAMMRCSPFGFAAPSAQDFENAKQKGIEMEARVPEPKNVAVLMRWLLSVSGCIPTEGSYRRNGGTSDPLVLNNYCIARPQLRTENPTADNDLSEALARCTLFENPGYFDVEILKKYDTPWQLRLVRLNSRRKPNTNAGQNEG